MYTRGCGPSRSTVSQPGTYCPEKAYLRTEQPAKNQFDAVAQRLFGNRVEDRRQTGHAQIEDGSKLHLDAFWFLDHPPTTGKAFEVSVDLGELDDSVVLVKVVSFGPPQHTAAEVYRPGGGQHHAVPLDDGHLAHRFRILRISFEVSDPGEHGVGVSPGEGGRYADITHAALRSARPAPDSIISTGGAPPWRHRRTRRAASRCRFRPAQPVASTGSPCAH